jgi:hypothetical protein
MRREAEGFEVVAEDDVTIVLSHDLGRSRRQLRDERIRLRDVAHGDGGWLRAVDANGSSGSRARLVPLPIVVVQIDPVLVFDLVRVGHDRDLMAPFGELPCEPVRRHAHAALDGQVFHDETRLDHDGLS